MPLAPVTLRGGGLAVERLGALLSVPQLSVWEVWKRDGMKHIYPNCHGLCCHYIRIRDTGSLLFAQELQIVEVTV